MRWLSRGKILSRVISLRTEIHIFLTERKHPLAEKFSDPAWVAKLAFLSDIFEHLNQLNTEIQGKNRTIVDISEQISSFKLKLSLWGKKLSRGKIGSFPRLNEFLEDSNNVTLENMANIFLEYMAKLEQELDRYILKMLNYVNIVG